MRPVLITSPAALPVTLAAMKEHLRVSHDDEDDLIEAYIDAAVAYLDGWSGILGRCIAEQTWAVKMSGFPSSRRLSLPFPDVSSVMLQYYSNGALETVSASLYRLQEDGRSAWLELDDDASWPTADDRADAVTATMTAGFEVTPASIVQAIKLLVGHWYRTREAVGPSEMSVPLAFDAVVAPMRRVAM
jgi:uncharacterized phiE125 gp8 family phage protein